MGPKNRNYLLLLFSSLSLRHIFHSPIFPQAHANMTLVETHFHFI
jgi:hypothetical protein